jgi:quercetin dioxygenase-like cupin family protein
MPVSEGHTYSKSHQLSGEVLTLDLLAEGGSLLAEARVAATGRSARTLVKDGALRLTLLALRDGAAIEEHRVTGALSIQVLRGSIAVGLAGQTRQLTERQALVLEPDVIHSVAATAESLVLLTIAMSGA